MKFTQIRNATAKIEYGNHTFLLDPWLTDYVDSEELQKKIQEKRFIGLPVKDLPLSLSEIMDGVDFLLITHLHEDHFSKDHLPKKLPVIVQDEKDKKILENLGFDHVSTFRDDRLNIDGIRIRRVDAVHGDNDKLLSQVGNTSGYMLSSDNEPSLYLIGDSVYVPSIQDNIEEFNPEILVVNGCDARVSRGRLIMNEKDIFDLADANPEREIIVSHMDGVSHAHLTRQELKESVTKSGKSKQVLIPEDGQSLAFPKN